MCGLAVCGDRNRLRRRRRNRGRGRRSFGWPRLGKNRLAGHALLQQQLGRLHAAVGVKSFDEHVVADHIGERHERHTLMVREEGPHDGRLRVGRRGRRDVGLLSRPVVDGFVEAEASVQPAAGEPPEVRRRGGGIDQARQRGRIRGDHELVRESALQAEARHAERLVLVGAGAIGRPHRPTPRCPRGCRARRRIRSGDVRRRGSFDPAACRGTPASAAAASGTRTSSRPRTSASRGR